MDGGEASEHSADLYWPHKPPRRDDIDLKQEWIAKLLEDAGCEGLLVLKRSNFRWLTSGAQLGGLMGYDEMPVLFFNSQQRWLLSSNTDSQRLFDEELDQLGFQLKEWQWFVSRDQMLADMCLGRKMACDAAFRDCKYVGHLLDQARRRLSNFEQERMRELGTQLVHALEATCRNIGPGETETEIAGHLAHRLLKHGVEPSAISIAGDGKCKLYRRLGWSEARVEQGCVIQATGCRFGLYATASRSVCFDQPDEKTRKEFDVAVRLSGVWLAIAKAHHRPAESLEAGKHLLYNGRFEHEYRLAAPGCWTGRDPSEGLLTPTADLFESGHAIVWQARIGGAAVCDTYLCQEDGWLPVTPVLQWPVRRVVVQGRAYDRPDLLIQVRE